MKTVRRKVFITIISLIVLNFTFGGEIYAQASGSFFMLPENFNSQMLNPSYMRTDDATVFTVVGFGGATIGNSSNFNLSDILYKTDEGAIGFDFDKLYSGKDSKYLINNWSTVPAIFIDIPYANGRLSFSYREKIESSLSFSLTRKNFEKDVNSPATFKSYYSDNIKLSGIGYHDIAVGYATQITENISVGVRGRILFGAVLSEIDDWNYGIDYTEKGDQIELRHKGTGKIELPVTFYLNEDDRVLAVNSEHIIRNYFGNFHNPGIGIDLGATVKLTEKSWMSVSATDIGVIWFRHNAMDIQQDTSFVFETYEDIHDYIGFDDNGEAYVDPYELIVQTKDEHSYLYQPLVDTIKAGQGLFPKIALHFQHDLYSNLSFSFTNQSAFYKQSFLNILTFSTLQKAGDFTFFENINMYGTNSFTFGAGMQWEGRYVQMFAVTDNVEAVFSTTHNKSFSMSVGIAFLLNKPNEPKPERKKSPKGSSSKRKKSRGRVSPYLPFYKIKR